MVRVSPYPGSATDRIDQAWRRAIYVGTRHRWVSADRSGLVPPLLVGKASYPMAESAASGKVNAARGGG